MVPLYHKGITMARRRNVTLHYLVSSALSAAMRHGCKAKVIVDTDRLRVRIESNDHVNVMLQPNGHQIKITAVGHGSKLIEQGAEAVSAAYREFIG